MNSPVNNHDPSLAPIADHTPTEPSPILSYSRENWRGAQISVLATFFGIMQVPALFAALVGIYTTHNGQPVNLVKDSIAWLFSCAITFPTIIVSIYGIRYCRKTNQVKIIILCATTIAVSLILLLWVHAEWYNNVYLVRNDNYECF
jgi:hypothetical membrane protein